MVTVFPHAVNGRLEDGLVDVLELSLADDSVGAGSICSHATSVWAGVSVANALVVLGGRERGNGVAVAEGQDAALFTLEEFLNDDHASCVAKLSVEHNVLESGVGFVGRLRDDDTLAGSQTISLDDDGVVDGIEVLLCGFVVAEVFVCSGRDVVGLHKVLAEGLAAFHAGSRLGGTEAADGWGMFLEVVDNASNEGSFRTGDEEVAVVLFCKGDKGWEVFLGDGGDVGHILQTAVSGQMCISMCCDVK